MLTLEIIPILKNILSYFECKKCGECCIYSPIFLQDEEVTAYLKLYGTAFFDMLDENSIENHLKHPCGFLDGKQCNIHNIIKPLTCTIHPFLLRYTKDNLYERYRVSAVVISLCPMGIEIDKKFLKFFQLNKIQIQNNTTLTQLNDVKTNKKDRIDYRIIDYKYLIPFYEFLKRKPLNNRTLQAIS